MTDLNPAGKAAFYQGETLSRTRLIILLGKGRGGGEEGEIGQRRRTERRERTVSASSPCLKEQFFEEVQSVFSHTAALSAQLGSQSKAAYDFLQLVSVLDNLPGRWRQTERLDWVLANSGKMHPQ